ncbi:unnamed protein product [Meloidogyne enterolobii]|uniref:Uncharacterized protein n=1 Tax=Meloidogyne enterolobii TaxID=390850 RepID=A0ACB0ZXY7_MELEN
MSSKKYTETPVKEAIVRAKNQGQSSKAVAALFNVKVRTVQHIYKLSQERGHSHRLPKTGRPKKLSNADERILIRPVRDNPNLSARDVAKQAQLQLGVTITRWTRFNFHNPDGGNFIRRPPNKRYDPKFIKSTMKYGGGGIMAWGCFSRDGIGPLVRIHGNMTAIMYRDILANNMIPHAREKLARGWKFMQDNDSKHTSRLLRGGIDKNGRVTFSWWRQNGIDLMITPPYSPDINPIEHLWSVVKRKLRGNRFRNGDQLWESVLAAWNSIPIETLINLVNSMPSRLHAIIRANGGVTKY